MGNRAEEAKQAGEAEVYRKLGALQGVVKSVTRSIEVKADFDERLGGGANCSPETLRRFARQLGEALDASERRNEDGGK